MKSSPGSITSLSKRGQVTQSHWDLDSYLRIGDNVTSAMVRMKYNYGREEWSICSIKSCHYISAHKHI